MRIEGGSVLHPGVPNPQNNLDHKKSSTAISKEMKELVWVICLSVVFCFHFKVKVLVTQSCLTLCDPMDCSSPGSSIHGILQARILE